MVYNREEKEIMKKVFTIFAAVMMLASVSFAQRTAQRTSLKPNATQVAKLMQKHEISTKAAGDTIATFPWEEGFETTPLTGFTFIDADGDGNNWGIVSNTVDHFNTHNGDGVIVSASYDNDNDIALTPDNWMILPAFTLPENADEFKLTWFEKGQDANYAEEYYSVYISTTGNTVADFTATTPVLSSTSTGDWVKKTVYIDNYAGETIFIAFRHHNVTDMFFLNIDDIRVGGAEMPEVTIHGPASVHTGDTVVFTADIDVPNFYWNILDADYEDIDSNVATVVWLTEGVYTVSVEATNSAGTTTDSLSVNVVDCSQPIADFPYVEGFESGIGCWITVSGDPANDEEFLITDQISYNESGHSFQFSSYATAESGNYNQYLISPELEIPASVDYMVSFKYNAENAGDVFRVLGSTTTTDTAAFTTVLYDMTSPMTDGWYEFACVIPQNIKYICINYYGDWAYYLNIDDFTISELTAPSVTLDGPATIGSRIQATFTAVSTLAETYSWTVNGDPVNANNNVLNYTFSEAGTYTVEVTATNSIGSNSEALEVIVFDCNNNLLPYTPSFTEGLNCWYTRQDLTEGFGWYPSVEMFEENPVGQVLSMSAQNIMGFFMLDVDVDNWLFSPYINMPENGSYDIAWKVMPFAADYAADHYGVYVISGGQETLLFEETLNSSITSFHQRVASIPAGISGEFQIAFRHFDNPGGGYVVILDEIQIVNAGTVTAIDDVDNMNVAVYPNPVCNVLNVEGSDIQQVEIMDLNGRTILTTNEKAINISNLASGMYMVRVITAEGIHTTKIVKQ